MNKLEELYAFIDERSNDKDISPVQLDIYKKAEEILIMEDVAVRVAKAVEAELSGIRRPITLVVDYVPNGKVRVRPVHETTMDDYVLPIHMEGNAEEATQDNQTGTYPESDVNVVSEAEPIVRKKTASVGFSVTIDGAEFRGKDAKETFFLALKHIGLRRILDDVEAHGVKHKVESEKVGVVWHTLFRYSKGNNIGSSPQEEVDNLYIYKGLSNDVKVDDIIRLCNFYRLNATIEWDNGVVQTSNITEEVNTPDDINEKATEPILITNHNMNDSEKHDLRITVDGVSFQEKNAIQTFISALLHIGLDNVAKVGIICSGYNLVDTRKRTDGTRKWQQQVDGKWIYIYFSNPTKCKYLFQIAEYLYKEIKIEAV